MSLSMMAARQVHARRRIFARRLPRATHDCGNGALPRRKPNLTGVLKGLSA